MNPHYEVVSPAGDPRDAAGSTKKTIGAAPLGELRGKKLGLIWTEFYNGDTVLRAFRQHLSARFPDLQFVEMAPGRGLSCKAKRISPVARSTLLRCPSGRKRIRPAGDTVQAAGPLGTRHTILPFARSMQAVSRLESTITLSPHRNVARRSRPGTVATQRAVKRILPPRSQTPVAIDRRQRRKGYGAALHTAAIDDLLQSPARALFLEVDESNTAARRLYRRFGFRETGRRKDYYQTESGKPASALVLRLDLG